MQFWLVSHSPSGSQGVTTAPPPHGTSCPPIGNSAKLSREKISGSDSNFPRFYKTKIPRLCLFFFYLFCFFFFFCVFVEILKVESEEVKEWEKWEGESGFGVTFFFCLVLMVKWKKGGRKRKVKTWGAEAAAKLYSPQLPFFNIFYLIYLFVFTTLSFLSECKSKEEAQPWLTSIVLWARIP